MLKELAKAKDLTFIISFSIQHSAFRIL
jgi:hypothetical protein